MDQETYERHQASVLTLLREKPKNLAEQVGRFWAQIDLRYRDFETRQKLIEAVETTQLNDVVAVYRQLLLSPGKTLRVVAGSNVADPVAVVDEDRFLLPTN